jgi:hypothetical protein
MRVTIEPPDGWGPRRILIVQLERLGYRVSELRFVGDGTSVLVITGQPKPPRKSRGNDHAPKSYRNT